MERIRFYMPLILFFIILLPLISNDQCQGWEAAPTKQGSLAIDESPSASEDSLIFCWHLPHFSDGSGGLDWIAPDYKSVRPGLTVIKASAIKEAADEGCDVFIKSPGPTPNNAEVYSVFSKRLLLDIPTIKCMGFSSSTYHTCAKLLSRKIFESFDPGTPNYLRVIAEKNQYQMRVQSQNKQQNDRLKPLESSNFTVRSDIDEIPLFKAKPNKNAYAIVIGIENYRQKLPKVDFAVSDAKLVSDYLSKVMGYPEENIVVLNNEQASKSDFEKYFEQWLSNNVETGSSVFIYYSGHGAPNPKTGDSYLVPYDGDPAFIEKTGYSLKRMYEALGKLPAKEIMVALDSCFSGAGGRSVIAEGSRPLVMNLDKSLTISKNMTVLAAASGSQISSTYKEKGHGLFTYFFLKGIKNEEVIKQDGSIAVGDLFTYLKPQVERIARKQYNNEQVPQLIESK